MVVRELITTLGFKTDSGAVAKYQKSMKTLKKSLLVVAAAGAAVGAGLLKIATDTAKAADDVGLASTGLGITSVALQELEFAAKTSGVSVGQVRKGIRKLSQAVDKAARGSEEYATAFSKMGIDIRDGNHQLKSADVLMNELGDGFAKIPNKMDKTNVAMTLFGRTNGVMLNMMNKGTEAMEKSRQAAHDLGIIMGDDLVKDSGDFIILMDVLKMVFQGFRNSIGAELIPILLDAGNAILTWVAANRELIKSKIKEYLDNFIVVMKGLWKIFKKVWGVLTFIVDLFGGLENAVRFAGYALAAFMTIKIGGALWGIVAGLKAVGSAFTKAGLKAALAWVKMYGPAILVGALILGLILLLDDLAAWGRGEKSIMGEMFPGIAFEKINGYITMIKTGLLVLIAVIALAFGGWIPALILAIGSVLVMLIDSWGEIKAFFSHLFGWIKAEFILLGFAIGQKLFEWFFPLVDAWDTAQANIKAGFKMMVDYMVGLVDKIFGAISRVGDVFGKTAGKARSLLNRIPGVNIGSGTDIAGAAQGGGAAGPGVDARRRANQAANNRSNQTNVGEVAVNINGSTNMGPGELARATADGIREALGRTFQNAGEAFDAGDY